MRTWPGQQIDESFLDTGLQLFTIDTVVAASPGSAWERLAARDRQQFIPGIRGDWVTPPPTTVGARRTITLAGMTQFEEHYFLWDDPARRWALYIARFGIPGLSALAEEVTVSAHPDGSRIRWRVVVTNTVVLRWVSALTRPLLMVVGPRLLARKFTAEVAEQD